MNLRNGYAQYREQSVLTAGPGDLVLMLYDACLRNLRLARLALTAGQGIRPDYETAGSTLKKAQDIVMELINALDFSYDIANQLFRLYEYIDFQLIQANIHKDARLIQNIEEIVTELRSAWEQAIRISRSQAAAAGE